jgi:hypothetical protein
MEEPAVIAFNASEEPSAPPMGGGGGIWNFGGSGTTPKPGQSVIQIPTSPAPTAPQQKATISVPSVAAYESGKLGISRDYYYNPNTNHTIYTLRIENRGNTTLRVSIKDVIPKSFAEHVSEVAIRPKPDTIYKEDPEVGWRALFGPSTMLVISYEFNKYIPLEDIQNLPAPEITLITTPAGAAAAATTTQTTATPLTGVTALVVGALNNPVSGISAVIFIALACLLYARGRDVETAIRSLKPSRPLRRHARNYAKVAVAAAVFLGIVLALAQVVVFGTMLVVLAALLATATWRGKELQVALRAIPPGVRAWCAAAAARVRKSIVVRKLAAFWRWFLATRVGMALKRFTAWLGRGYGRVKASWFGRALGKARAKTVAGWRWLKASRLGRGAGWLKARIASAGHTLKAWIMGAPEIVAEEVARTERIFELVREVPAQAGEGW